jgi:hypothetical protein
MTAGVPLPAARAARAGSGGGADAEAAAADSGGGAVTTRVDAVAAEINAAFFSANASANCTRVLRFLDMFSPYNKL